MNATLWIGRVLRAWCVTVLALAIAPPSCCTVNLWTDGAPGLFGFAAAGYSVTKCLEGELCLVPGDEPSLRLELSSPLVAGLRAGPLDGGTCFELRAADDGGVAVLGELATGDAAAERGRPAGVRVFVIDDEQGARRWLLQREPPAAPLPDVGDLRTLQRLVEAGTVPVVARPLPARPRSGRVLATAQLVWLEVDAGPGAGSTLARIVLTPVALVCDAVTGAFVLAGWWLASLGDEDEEHDEDDASWFASGRYPQP